MLVRLVQTKVFACLNPIERSNAVNSHFLQVLWLSSTNLLTEIKQDGQGQLYDCQGDWQAYKSKGIAEAKMVLPNVSETVS
jgi:hypothetical protein